MRFAIVSDIHANWQAWCAMREDLRAQQVDTVVCLGDVVGYGPNPQGVLNGVRQCCDNILMGNHEAAAVGLLDLDIFNPGARRAAEWTTTQLDGEAKEHLRQLPLSLEDEDILFVHAEPVAPEEWGYVETLADAQTCFKSTDKRVTFIGHTHFPEIFTLRPDGQLTQIPPTELALEMGTRYLVNVGSVGEPRDGTSEASYCIYDATAQRLNFRRVTFDLAALARDIRQQPQLGLPWFLKEHALGEPPEKREHAIRVPKVATTRIHVRASDRVRIQVGRNQKLTTTPVVAPLPPPTAARPAAQTEPVAAHRRRRVLWLAGGFFIFAIGLFAVAAVLYFKNSAPAQHTAVPQPQPPTVATAPVQPRAVVLLAKDAQLHGAALRKETRGAEVNIGCWESPFDYVSWTFNVEQPGSYDVSLVYAVPAFAAGRDFELSCGKARLFHKRLASTGDWFSFQCLHLGQMQMTAGVQLLNVKPVGRGKQGLMNLRELRLQCAGD